MNLTNHPQPAAPVSFAATPASSRGQVALKVILVLLLVVCGLRIWVKAAPEALKRSSDFRAVYLSTHTMVKGVNPYDHSELDKVYLEAGGILEDGPGWHMTPSVYPPVPFTFFVPLALLPHAVAVRVLLAINILCLVITWWAIAKWTRIPLSDWRALLLGVIIFSLGPVVTSIKLGQPGIMAVTATVLSLWLASCGKKHWRPGLLLGIAIVLKPQIGGVFFLSYAAQKRWRICAVSLLLPFICGVVAVARLQSTAPGWFSQFKENLHSAEVGNDGVVGFNNPTLANPDRYEMVHLPILLHDFLENRTLVTLLSIGITLAFAAILALRLRRADLKASGLLPFAVIAVITLFPVYHRYYDGILLIPAVACAVALMRRGTRRWAVALGIFLMPFVVSWTFILDQWRIAGRIPEAVTQSWTWNSLIMPHQVWALLGLAVVLIAMVRRPPVLPED